MAESETTYKKLSRIQIRVRTPGGGSEDEQFLAWLEGSARKYFVPIKTASDRSMELQLMDLLREAFLEQKRVKLAYRSANGNRYISAAWVEH